MNDIPSSEITPEPLFRSRRQFMRSAAALIGGTALLSACGIEASPAGSNQSGATAAAGPGSGTTDELCDQLTDYAADSGYYTWPYVEGLRLDEAMNDLALLVTGVYGKPALPQNGAPLRLSVPWKYGFKSIKAIVKIDLVADQPTSLWMNAAPNEYGFY